MVVIDDMGDGRIIRYEPNKPKSPSFIDKLRNFKEDFPFLRERLHTHMIEVFPFKSGNYVKKSLELYAHVISNVPAFYKLIGDEKNELLSNNRAVEAYMMAAMDSATADKRVELCGRADVMRSRYKQSVFKNL